MAGPTPVAGGSLSERLLVKVLQRYWRLRRSVTLGAQGIVIDPNGRILLIRHGYRAGWHFPGGGVERGEHIRLSLARELEEEAGIVLDGEPELLGLFSNFEKFPGDHIAVFVVRRWRQPSIPKSNAEIAEQGFFAPDALPAGTSAGTRRRIDELVHGARGDGTW
jgi:8-oxo-dGTP pyrophosphatase MutT (NUDIX family)